jgi:hypothetical protein
MRSTADQSVFSVLHRERRELEVVGLGPEETAWINWIEPTSTMDAGQILINRLTVREAEVLDRRIDIILSNPTGLPSGKNKRVKLNEIQALQLKSALIEAVEHAAVWVAYGSLPNHLHRPGRPPDNAVFLFIDDVVRACKASGLKPGLRYVAGSESLPVLLFIKLAQGLWPGSARAPRRLFERWQREAPFLFRQ